MILSESYIQSRVFFIDQQEAEGASCHGFVIAIIYNFKNRLSKISCRDYLMAIITSGTKFIKWQTLQLLD